MVSPSVVEVERQADVSWRGVSLQAFRANGVAFGRVAGRSEAEV